MNFENNLPPKQNTLNDAAENRKILNSLHRQIHKITLMGKTASLEVENNIWLAPLAGVTDRAFRVICKECGGLIHSEPGAAPGLVFTEMISAKGIHYKGNNSILLADTDAREQPVSVQIFGSDPEIMAESAELLKRRGARVFDINMGCPMHKITANGEGSALLTNPKLIEKIVSAVSERTGLPVTVKIRRGFVSGKETCAEAARAAESGGAAAVTVHGRFRDEYYSGKADIQAVARVKQAVQIPVVGNGDIDSPSAALKMFEQSGCDGIMIGRAALGRPWIFYQLLGQDTPAGLPPKQILEIIKRHISYVMDWKGEKQGIVELRKHLAWYIKGYRGSAAVRDQLFKAATQKDAVQLIEDFYTAL